MAMLELDDYVHYGIEFVKRFNEYMGWAMTDDDLYDDRAEVAILKLLNDGLAVVPCNPDDPRMDSPFLAEGPPMAMGRGPRE